MRAWVVHKPGPVVTGPLCLAERPVPEPGPGELLIQVLRCGVCRTDLHPAAGDLEPKRLAERLRLKVTVNPYPFDRGDQAVADLVTERFTGAAVISM